MKTLITIIIGLFLIQGCAAKQCRAPQNTHHCCCEKHECKCDCAKCKKGLHKECACHK